MDTCRARSNSVSSHSLRVIPGPRRRQVEKTLLRRTQVLGLQYNFRTTTKRPVLLMTSSMSKTELAAKFIRDKRTRSTFQAFSVSWFGFSRHSCQARAASGRLMLADTNGPANKHISMTISRTNRARIFSSKGSKARQPSAACFYAHSTVEAFGLVAEVEAVQQEIDTIDVLLGSNNPWLPRRYPL